MENINNNQFEVQPISSKRKLMSQSNVYLNPALDLLANEDRICNTAMEIPVKKRKRTKSCDVVAFENSALELGAKPVNQVLVREIDNVRKLKALQHDQERFIIPSTSKIDGESLKFIDTDDVDFTDTAEDSDIFNDNENNDYTSTNVVENNLVTEPIYENLSSHCPIPKTVHNLPAIKMPQSMKMPLAEPVDIETTAGNTTDILYCGDISTIEKSKAENDTDSGVSVLEQNRPESANISNVTNIRSNLTNQIILNNSNLSLSFIDRLALDSPNVSDRSLFYDDDLNESNIMEVKTITIITKKKRIIGKKNTNPFLNPNLDTDIEIPKNNPFLDLKPEVEYREGVLNQQEETAIANSNAIQPRRLFENTNSTISTVNESSIESQHEYENIDNFREYPIYENIEELNKQSKILGCDVSRLNTADIINNKKDNSTDSNDSRKHYFFKPGKLSKKVFKTLKKTFKHDKADSNITLNPYEVPRKPIKQKTAAKESGIENPALNLDNSDDLEFEELSDEEHQYETIKTLRNTRLNMNVTPLRERNEDVDVSKGTPGKKVRFDSTLNQEKVITGNSFDCSMASPGFDAKIDKFHDELENCINERKFLQQNM